jgi:hypothetical protein
VVEHVAVGRSRLRNLRADLARCQAGGRALLAFGAARDALGGALLLILLALSLVRRGFLIGWHYLTLRFRLVTPARPAGHAVGGTLGDRAGSENVSTPFSRFEELGCRFVQVGSVVPARQSVPFGVPPQLRITRAERRGQSNAL